MKTYTPFLLYAALALLSFGVQAQTPPLPLPPTASSVNAETFLPEYAFDGNSQTRWASALSSGQDEWLQVDLGEPLELQTLTILWETAAAVDYEIQMSPDGCAWTRVYHQPASPGGEEKLSGLNGGGRYLRILCHKPNSFGLYSIWEISSTDPKIQTALGRTRETLQAAKLEATRAAREKLRTRLRDNGVDEIVFASRPLYPDGHWYANISYFAQDENLKTYAKGGGVYIYRMGTNQTVPLIEDAEGTLRDPAVHYDGKTILFSWRKGGTDSFHLYTIQRDGTGLRQLTDGQYDDIEPAWLPDGGIVFVSSRCRRWVNCWLTQVAVVHRCNADGTNVMPLSANLEHDNTPWPMPDGRILYTRWEYVDRSQVDYHHLWTVNPDGTAHQTYFGNMHPGGVFIDAKPIPGTEDVLFVNSPGHGQKEHVGRIALVNAKRGPDDLSSIRNISEGDCRDPYPVAADVFLAAAGRTMIALGPDGTRETILTLPEGPVELHEPRPIISRPCEPVIPPRVNYTRNTGRMVLSNVHAGRNMQGVNPGDIKRLLVLESLPKPINYTGGMDPLTYGGSFTLERVLGTVPVENDGSAYFEVPANRAIFFVALDANNNSVKRMQSFASTMPGETQSCTGCHEFRSNSAVNRSEPRLQALGRAPSKIEPVAGIPDVLDFPRDIQPILDKHCVACHDYTKHKDAKAGPRAGGIILTGDHGPLYSHSYATLTVYGQFKDGRDQPVSNLPPRTIGTSASPLMQKIGGGHHGVKVSQQEEDTIRYWIESGAPYPGTYAGLGNGGIGGYYANQPVHDDKDWPESQAARKVILDRCVSCHKGNERIPRHLSDENDVSFWRPEWNDPRLKRARHLMFNLSRPELSMMLLAPLSKKAGGLGLCNAGTDKKFKPVFKKKKDPGYRQILAMIQAGKTKLEEIKRFDMPGFRPPAPYIREMKRYGALPADLPDDAPINPYETDQAYWRAFEQDVALQHPAYLPSK